MEEIRKRRTKKGKERGRRKDEEDGIPVNKNGRCENNINRERE